MSGGINVASNLAANAVNGSTGVEEGSNRVGMIGQQKLVQQTSGGPGPPGAIQNGTSPHISGTEPGQVLLKDVSSLVRLNVVAVPSGFTKLGSPVLYFPDNPSSSGLFSGVSDSDLHILFKYYLAVVPRFNSQKLHKIVQIRIIVNRN